MPNTHYPSERGGRFIPSEAFGEPAEDDVVHSQEFASEREYRSPAALSRHREHETELIKKIDRERKFGKKKDINVPWELHPPKSAKIRQVSPGANKRMKSGEALGNNNGGNGSYEFGRQVLPEIDKTKKPADTSQFRTGRGKK